MPEEGSKLPLVQGRLLDGLPFTVGEQSLCDIQIDEPKLGMAELYN